MEDNQQDDRIDLYRRFLDEIANSPQTVYFDENELIDIYDAASDANDDFARMEVLLCGARLFPDSVELAERKAYLYYDIGNHEAAKNVIDKLPDSSVIKRLLDTRINVSDHDQAIQSLDEIVCTGADFSDEEIIQLVDTAGDFGLYNWLKDNKSKIMALTDYPQTYLYEMVNLAEMSGDYKYAIGLLEELTMLEPFNSEFWEMLAGMDIMYFSDANAALNAVDYALAINPDSRKALLLKAQCMYELEMSFDEVESSLERLIESDPDDSIAVNYLAFVKISRNNDVAAAMDILDKYITKHKDDKNTVDYMLTISEGRGMEPVMDDFYRSTDMKIEDDWQKWAKAQYDEGHYMASATILKTFLRNSGNISDVDRLILVFYRAGWFIDVVKTYEHFNETKSEDKRLSNMSFWLYAMARLRIGKKEGLLEMLESAFATITKSNYVPDTVEEHLQTIGVAFKLATMINIIKGLDDGNINDIDPFSAK